MKNFEEYYEFYLSKHQNKNCRRMHLLGNIVTIAFVIWVIAGAHWWCLLAAPFIVYPFAIVGHAFEGEKPAFLSSNPCKAKLADMKMCWEMVTGKLPL